MINDTVKKICLILYASIVPANGQILRVFARPSAGTVMTEFVSCI